MIWHLSSSCKPPDNFQRSSLITRRLCTICLSIQGDQHDFSLGTVFFLVHLFIQWIFHRYNFTIVRNWNQHTVIASGFWVKYYEHNTSRTERLIKKLKVTKEIQIAGNMYKIDDTYKIRSMGHSTKEQLTWQFWNTAAYECTCEYLWTKLKTFLFAWSTRKSNLYGWLRGLGLGGELISTG